MSVRSGQSITKTFTTRVFATGVATNADSTPTGTLYVNGTADAASVTVSNITTGLYKAAVTLPTLAVGDVVDLRINATVSSVTDNAVIWTDTKDIDLGATGKTPATIAAGDLATDSITAAAVKADAVTKIQSGLATQTSVDDLPTNAELATALAAADDAVLAAISGLTDVTAGEIRTELASELLVMTRLGTAIVLDGAVYQFTTNALENAPGGSGSTVNVMPVSGSATTGNVLDGGRIKGQYGAPLTGLTITCTTTNAGTTTNRDLTAYDGALAFVVFDNDDTMDYGTRIVNGADITVSSNVATISSTASHVLNTTLGENLRWCLRQDTAAPSIVFAIWDYTCQRAPVTA